jgi:type IV pilus assembly protein PilE
MHNQPNGFTLIELLIILAITGILAGIAYPSYTEYVKRAHRADITGLLTDTAQQLERFYSRNAQYSDVVGPPAVTLQLSAGNGVYAIVAQREVQSFELVAMPVAGGVMDGDRCGGFVIDNVGKRGSVGVGGEGCWGR